MCVQTAGTRGEIGFDAAIVNIDLIVAVKAYKTFFKLAPSSIHPHLSINTDTTLKTSPRIAMAPQLIDIAPYGDVVLVCTIPGESGVYHLHVSSIFLSHGSTVFKAMFGPHFKEGHALTSGPGTVEIPLPEDNLDGMIMICQALHLQHHLLPSKVQPFQLLQVALLTDKYDCIDVLRFASEVWLKQAEAEAIPEDLLEVLYAASYFIQAALFGHLAQSVVLRSEGTISDLVESESSELNTCIKQLNMTKQQVQRQLHRFIEEDVQWRGGRCDYDEYDEDAGEAPTQCANTAIVVTVLLRRLSSVKVWPASAWLYHPVAINSVLAGMRSFDTKEVDFENTSPVCVDECGCLDSLEDIRSLYAAKADKVALFVPGMCYHCVREGRDLNKGRCGLHLKE
ncbi:hypothetical protein LTR27_007908 [Elasticomyces elasticus]|nr:hypothetical protein LTR27_007908 [Elasticomyces elasticus]